MSLVLIDFPNQRVLYALHPVYVHIINTRILFPDRKFIFRSLEIVQVQRPDHCAAEVIAHDEFGLESDHVLVVERHPLVTFVGVRTHPAQRVLDQLPIAFHHFVADLKTQRTCKNQKIRKCVVVNILTS